MIKLSIKRNRLFIEFIDGLLSDIESVNIIGWKQDASKNTASCTLDIENVDSLLSQMKVQASQEVKDWYKKEFRKRKIAIQAHNSFNLDMTGLNEEMKEYQKKAVNFFIQTNNCIVAYEMGLGKSLIAINCIKAFKRVNKKIKVMIVCPAHLKYSWASEITKWSDLTYTIIEGTPKNRDILYKEFKENNNEVLINNYEQMRIKMKKGKVESINVHEYIQKTKFDLVIWDEVHRLKTRDSQISIAAYAINTKARIMLSGTLITKNAGEVYSPLRILDRDRFKAYWQFVEFYCHVSMNDFRGMDIGGLKRPQAFKKLMNQYMIRKTKMEVAPELPDKIFIEIPVKMGDKQLKAYNTAMNDWMNPDGESIESDVEKFIRLCQINQNPAILGGDDVSISRDTTLELIEDIEPQRIIVSCMYIGMSTLLSESIKKRFPDRNVYLNNSTIKDRHLIVELFKKDKTGILVTTIGCAKEGYNIDECDIMILNDIAWNYGDNLQHQDRIHRMNSTRKKTYYFIVVKDTVHEYKHHKIYKEQFECKGAMGDKQEDVLRSLMRTIKETKLNGKTN